MKHLTWFLGNSVLIKVSFLPSISSCNTMYLPTSDKTQHHVKKECCCRGHQTCALVPALNGGGVALRKSLYLLSPFLKKRRIAGDKLYLPFLLCHFMHGVNYDSNHTHHNQDWSHASGTKIQL